MIAIKNGRLVLPDRVQDGKILVLADDRIRGIEDEIPQGADRVIDAHGRYVLPGFLDIHSDRIEQFILPRPTLMAGAFGCNAHLLQRQTNLTANIFPPVERGDIQIARLIDRLCGRETVFVRLK